LIPDQDILENRVQAMRGAAKDAKPDPEYRKFLKRLV